MVFLVVFFIQKSLQSPCTSTRKSKEEKHLWLWNIFKFEELLNEKWAQWTSSPISCTWNCTCTKGCESVFKKTKQSSYKTWNHNLLTNQFICQILFMGNRTGVTTCSFMWACTAFLSLVPLTSHTEIQILFSEINNVKQTVLRSGFHWKATSSC